MPTLDSALRNPLWDKFIAPGISALKQQPLRTVPKELRPDPLQFSVTALLLEMEDASKRARIFNFVRRAQNVYDSYGRARRSYAAIFRNQDFYAYLAALNEFEACVAAAFQGHEVLFGLTKGPFQDKDGAGRAELNWRLTRIHNKSKHIEGVIRAQSFQGEPLSIWISNDGLQTQAELIRFDELYEIVFDMSLTGSIMAKSHLWRKEVPPLLMKYAHSIERTKERRTR